MAQITSYDGTPIVDAIVIGPDGQPGYSQTAKLGEPGFSNVIVDDPDGTFTFETWKDWTVDEDDCTFERLYTGIVYAIRVERGPYRDGPGRIWNLDIVDMGQLLKQRVISGADGQRPFEMDTARIDWLYNSDYLDGLVFDNGFLNVTDNPQGQFDADHRFEYPMDVFVSVAGPISKHAFVYWDGVAEEPSIFYDRFDVSLGDAGIGFSNVMSDVDESTVFYPKVDAEAFYDGEDRYGGLMLGWRGPSIYRQEATTVAAMGRVRDVTFQTDRIGLAATASNVTSLLLAQHADDLVSIKFSAELPSSAVNLVRPGQTLEVRFTHIPGFETTQEVFVRSTIVQQMWAGRYLVQYDVAPNPTVPLVPTGGDPGELPDNPVVCTADDFGVVASSVYSVSTAGADERSITISPAPITDDVVVVAISFRDPRPTCVPQPDGWALLANVPFSQTHQDFRITAYWKVWSDTDDDVLVFDFDTGGAAGDDLLLRMGVVELDGSMEPMVIDTESTDLLSSGLDPVAGTVTPDAGSDVLLVGMLGFANNVSTATSNIPNGAAIELIDTSQDSRAALWMGYEIVDEASGSYSMSVDHNVTTNGWGGILAAFTCVGEEAGACPATGQWVEDETVTLTGADGTTRCPFADLSLHVYIDNVEQTANLVSQDGETGDFTLGFDPTPTEVCTVRYQGR